MSYIHVYEIHDEDCCVTMRDGCKAIAEKYGCKVSPRMSMSKQSWEEMREKDFKHFGEAWDAIHTKHGKTKPKKDIVDKIECPRCKGVLHYRISSYNGHIAGQCKTKDCLCWMQ